MNFDISIILAMKMRRHFLYYIASLCAFVAFFMILAASSFHFHSFSFFTDFTQDSGTQAVFSPLQDHSGDEDSEHCSLCTYLNSVSFDSFTADYASYDTEIILRQFFCSSEKISSFPSFTDFARAPPASF